MSHIIWVISNLLCVQNYFDIEVISQNIICNNSFSHDCAITSMPFQRKLNRGVNGHRKIVAYYATVLRHSYNTVHTVTIHNNTVTRRRNKSEFSPHSIVKNFLAILLSFPVTHKFVIIISLSLNLRHTIGEKNRAPDIPVAVKICQLTNLSVISRGIDISIPNGCPNRSSKEKSIAVVPNIGTPDRVQINFRNWRVVRSTRISIRKPFFWRIFSKKCP